MKNFANFGAQFTSSRHNQSIGIKLQLPTSLFRTQAIKPIKHQVKLGAAKYN